MARLIDVKNALVVQFPLAPVESDPLRYLLNRIANVQPKVSLRKRQSRGRSALSAFEKKNRNSSLTGHTNGVALFSADSFDEAFLNLVELIIAKQRNGPIGDVPLVFLREFTRFESRAKNRAV